MTGSGALGGRRVVLTRPATGRPDRLAALLTAAGADVVQVALIAIGAATDGGAALSTALARLDTFDWLVVTSSNGADRVGAAARRSSVRLAAVGDATAATLTDHAGRPVELVPAEQRTSGLLAVFPAGPARVLVAQGNLAGSELADGLSARGADVTVAEAYATVRRHPTGAELEVLRRADVVVLASGSAVPAWLAAAPPPGVASAAPAIVVIGPRTAGVAAGAGLAVAAVANSPTPDDVLAAVVKSLLGTGPVR